MSSRSPDNKRFDRAWLREHFAELVLFAISLSLFCIKLGIGELESWDESLQVVRVLAIEKFGVWLDQSSYALGGFYSSTHPPLGIWFIAISRELFGTSEFATRFPAAMAGVVAVLGMFALMRRYSSDRIALLMSAAFGASTLFLWYSRHAQLESFVLAFAIWAIVLYHRGMERDNWSMFVFAGLLLGLALMSKFLWGLFIMPYLIAITFKYDGTAKYWRFAIMVFVALAVAMPWHIYMAIAHPEFTQHVLDSLFGIGLSTDHEPGGSRGWIYYINQLIVNCPFIVAAVCLAIDRETDRRSAVIPAIWLFILFVTLQLVSTKMPHFAVLLLPAAFLLSAASINASEGMLMWVLMALSVLWSLSLQLRLLMRGASFEYVLPDLILAGIIALCLIAAIYLLKDRRAKHELILIGLAGAFVLVAFLKVYNYKEAIFTDGARHIGAKVNRLQHFNELTVLHSSLRNDSLTSRLAYYTDGWTAGWIPGKTSTKIAWDDEYALSRLSALDQARSGLVFERDWDRFNQRSEFELRRLDSIRRVLRSMYSNRDSLRSYDFYYD